MLLRQLEYLAALARERHFARAAAACRVGQGTLSEGIQRLEADLGVTIVHRGHRFGGFTPEGELVVQWAHRILADRETATRATAFDADSGGPFLGSLAMAPTGLLAVVQYANTGSAYYTYDSLVTLWDLGPMLGILADPISAACEVAGHDLSAELWRRHAPDIERRPICR